MQVTSSQIDEVKEEEIQMETMELEFSLENFVVEVIAEKVIAGEVMTVAFGNSVVAACLENGWVMGPIQKQNLVLRPFLEVLPPLDFPGGLFFSLPCFLSP